MTKNMAKMIDSLQNTQIK